MNHQQSGLLIAFEGIDGVGKSTQIRLLADKLIAQKYMVVITREPTDGRYGQQIRQLFNSRHISSAEEELALFVADRRQHVKEIIKPALTTGKIVLTDRYYFSTAAYQGTTGRNPEKIIKLNEEFAPVPDLVLLLTAPPATTVDRIERVRKESLNDFEQKSSLRKVSAIFDTIRRDFIKRIDGTASIMQVHKMIMHEVRLLLVRLLKDKQVL